jgi:hypothetical protein
MAKFTFIVNVYVDDDIAEKFPNYRFNWDSAEEFAKTRVGEEANTEEYGYKLTTKMLTRDQAKLLDTEE